MPQFVRSSTVHVRPPARRPRGRRSRCSGRGRGAFARSQPSGSAAREDAPVAGAAVVEACGPGRTRRRRRRRRARSRRRGHQEGEDRPRHGGQDNGALARRPCPSRLRPRAARPRRLRLGRRRPTPRAPEAITALREAGKGIAFVTNDGRHGDDEFVRKLWRLGFQASREEVVTVGGAMQHVLAESEHRTAYVIGAPPVHRHVADAGLRILNGSDLASARRRRRRRRARPLPLRASCGARCRRSRAARTLLCAGRDGTLPDARRPVAGDRARSWRRSRRPRATTARSVGKPEPQLFLTALDRLGDGPRARRRRPPRRRRRAAPARPAWTARSCSPATPRPQAAADADPAPTMVADSLAALVLGD